MRCIRATHQIAELAAEPVEEGPGVQPLAAVLDGASAVVLAAGISVAALFVGAADAAAAYVVDVAVVAAAFVVRLACEPPDRDGR